LSLFCEFETKVNFLRAGVISLIIVFKVIIQSRNKESCFEAEVGLVAVCGNLKIHIRWSIWSE